MRFTIILFILLLSSIPGFTQQEISNWFLNYQNRIKISPSGSITNLTIPSIIFSNETAAISDAAGNLLFMSTGFKVYDKNLSPMPFFSSLEMSGNYNLKIAPVPGNKNRYYLFYNNAPYAANIYTLKFAVIDMSLNGGLGDVISYDNIVDESIAREYTLVNKPGTEDFWIVTHRNSTDSFFSRLVETSGINYTPVKSKAGSNSLKTEYNFHDLRASHDGKMIAGYCYTDYSYIFANTIRFVQVFNFDGNTGILSEKIKSKRVQGYFSNGQVEFSPDNRLLYVCQSTAVDGLQPCGYGSSSLYQYNLCYSDSTDFTQNAMVVASTFSWCYLQYWGKMQMGPDKKIYLPYTGTGTLSRIESPNIIGTHCQVNFASHNLTGQTGSSAPKFYHRYVEKAVKNNIVYKGNCFPNPISFTISNDTITSAIWDFGDPVSGSNNSSSALAPQHYFSSPGTYLVKADLYNSEGALIEKISEKIEIKDPGQRLLKDYPTDTAFCQGNSLKLSLNAVNGIFRWKLGSSIYSISDSIVIYNSGKYYVEMLQNGCDGCYKIDSINVTVLPKPYLDLGYDRTFCSGDSLLLDAYFENADYLWNTGETTPSIWVKTTGTYSVKSEIDNNGCPSMDEVKITEVPQVQFSLPNDTLLCNNQSLVLDPGVSNAFYFWQNGSSANTFTVTQPGKYWVRITSQNGCSKSDTINVAYASAQSLNLGADTVLCIGDSIILKADVPAVKYEWSTGETSKTVILKTSGTYWVKADNGTCTITDTIKISFSPKPVFSLGKDTTLCEKQILTLTAALPNSTYLWQNNSTQDNFQVQQAGIYWVEVIQNGCSLRDSIAVSYKSLPILELGPDKNICSDETVQLNATHPSIKDYTWQNGSTLPSFTTSETGIYYVTVTGINNCINSDTIKIKTNPVPNFSLGKDTIICEGKAITLSIALSNATYTWNTGEQTNSLKVTQPGIYWAKAIQNNCAYTDSIVIGYKASPSVNLGTDTTLCEGSSLQLNSFYPGASYSWQNNSSQPNFIVNNAGTYNVAVNLNGCIANDTIKINYEKSPVFTLGPDLQYCEGQELFLKPNINNATFLWQDGSISPSFSVKKTGTYKLTAANKCGTSSDEIVITNGVCKLFMPNAFSPNGDGKNDVFNVRYTSFIKEFYMVVYNRWGVKIFETKNANQGWDGKFKGVPQVSDNYIWMIDYSTVDNKRETLKGSVILIR